MPKTTNLSEILNLAGVASTDQDIPDYFLFLLGTDTVFTPKPTTTRYYERGETLSYAAQAVVKLLGEEAQTDLSGAALSYSSNSVDLLNGPTTLGAEVGDRIAEAVLLALHAAASGKSNLQITAHSRGAVEAILVMHELERIEKSLRETPDTPLSEILINSPCQYTRRAMNSKISGASPSVSPRSSPNIAIEEDTVNNRYMLANKLAKLKVNPFLIDPVPGGRYCLIPTRWVDQRFYQKPKLEHHELIVCRDERTRSFIPVVPNGMQTTIMPGHHGTASGNFYDQQYKVKPEGTTGVQELVLCKLFDFYRQTSQFAPLEDELKLEHPALDAVLNEYLAADDETARKELFLKHYENIATHDRFYRSFANGGYPYLGIEKCANGKPEGARYIHNLEHNYQPLDTISASLQDSVVNHEHLRLKIGNVMASKPDDTVDQKFHSLSCTLATIVSSAPLDEDLDDLLSTTVGQEIFANYLSMLIDEISQKFLDSRTPRDLIDRLIPLIKDLFETLRKANEDQPRYALAKKCETRLKEAIKETANMHYLAINSQVEKVKQQIQRILAPVDDFTQVLEEFRESLSDKDEYSELKNELCQPDCMKDIHQVQNILLTALDTIRQREDLSDEAKEELLGELLGESVTKLRGFFEAHENSIEQYLEKMAQFHQDILRFKKIHDEIIDLVEPQELAFGKEQLVGMDRDLEMLEGNLLKEKEITRQHATIDTLEQQIQAQVNEANQQQQSYAIELAALKQRHKAERVFLYQQLDAQASETHQLRQDHQAAIAALQQRHEAEIDRLRLQIEQRNDVANQQNAHIQALHTPEEATSLSAIQNNLIPLTQKYLAHLRDQARKYFPNDVEANGNTLPDAEAILDLAKREAYNKIQMKFNRVQALYAILDDTTQLIKPSDRIKTFTQTLKEHERELKQHRDPAWRTFAKSCLAIIAIIGTGIIPGLVYAAVTGKSPLFFSQSQGGKYADACQSHIKPHLTRTAS